MMLSTWACTETSNAEVGWSQTRNSGSVAGARGHRDALALAARDLVRELVHVGLEQASEDEGKHARRPSVQPGTTRHRCAGSGQTVNSQSVWPAFSQANVALPLCLIPTGGGRLRPALGRSKAEQDRRGDARAALKTQKALCRALLQASPGKARAHHITSCQLPLQQACRPS